MREIILTPEQDMLREAAGRFLRERYDFRRRSEILESADGYDRAVWRAFAEMGWLGLALPEAHGGSGSMFDAALLMESFGEALVVEPYLATVVLGGQLLAKAGDPFASRFLPKIIAGECLFALAYTEPDSGYDARAIRTVARRDGPAYRLRGHKAVVLGAPMADYLIVTADSGVFLVERAAVRLRGYRTIDGARAAEVQLEDAPAERLGGLELLDHALAAGAVALTSQAVGALEGAVNATAQHLNTREQFGQKLAAYQALRHRLADMFILKEEVRALVRLAAVDFDEADAAARDISIAAAKAYAGEAGRRVCEEAVQLHGAIGITDEIMVGHYLKKLIAVDRTFGDTTAALDRFMQALG